MTKEEAIEQLQICKGLITQDGQDYLDERDIPLLDMAIEALSADAVQGWIPCSEQLPSNSEQVIISVRNDHGDTPYNYTTVGWKCEKCWISDNDYVFGDVLAWMPLPNSYKGK